MRVAVIGSRHISDQFYHMLCEKMPVGASEIISGGASGADALAERFAKERNLPLLLLTPDYASFGRRAPLLRTEHIVERADYVLALWDGSSRGTAYGIDFCLKTQTPVRVLLCQEPREGAHHA